MILLTHSRRDSPIRSAVGRDLQRRNEQFVAAHDIDRRRSATSTAKNRLIEFGSPLTIAAFDDTGHFADFEPRAFEGGAEHDHLPAVNKGVRYRLAQMTDVDANEFDGSACGRLLGDLRYRRTKRDFVHGADLRVNTPELGAASPNYRKSVEARLKVTHRWVQNLYRAIHTGTSESAGSRKRND